MTSETPFRAEHTYEQVLHGDPDDVFPLLCPVRETEWVRGWNPVRVISASGYAEKGCVFTTTDEFGTSTWFISAYDTDRHLIEFVKFTPGYFVVLISIQLLSRGPRKTSAVCTYQYTAVGEAGRDFVAGFTKEAYTAFMKEWEFELNHFLATGEKASESEV